MRCTAQSEQSTVLAISSSFSALLSCNLLLIMLWIGICLERARFGAIFGPAIDGDGQKARRSITK